MSASSSRIMIAQAEPARPWSDRLVDRLLGWWDIGGGRGLRRGLRDTTARYTGKVRTFIAPVLEKPWVSAIVRGLGSAKRWVGKAFSSDVPATLPRGEDLRATLATEMDDAPAPREATPVPPRPAAVTRSPTGELRPRTAPAITRPEITPVASDTATPTANAMTTALRCWSCHQRHRVRTPRRGGCFHCGQCDQTMLVVDPIVGLTCAIGDARERGIQLNHEANETDVIVRPSLI